MTEVRATTGARPLPGVAASAQIVPACDATVAPAAPGAPADRASPARRRARLRRPPQCSRAARPSGGAPGDHGRARDRHHRRIGDPRPVGQLRAQREAMAALTASVKNMPGQRGRRMVIGLRPGRPRAAWAGPSPPAGSPMISRCQARHTAPSSNAWTCSWAVWPGRLARPRRESRATTWRGQVGRGLPDPAPVVDGVRARPVPDHRDRPGRHALGRARRGTTRRRWWTGRTRPGAARRPRPAPRRRRPRRRAAAASAAPGAARLGVVLALGPGAARPTSAPRACPTSRRAGTCRRPGGALRARPGARSSRLRDGTMLIMPRWNRAPASFDRSSWETSIGFVTVTTFDAGQPVCSRVSRAW